ncbi:hypothetical protein Agau_P200597 (plasmid) [Agrobacterium tumefaciens F2]|nr:hypothetical protein Agau_P200597 [Agrobacterium tumefaciens F2]
MELCGKVAPISAESRISHILVAPSGWVAVLIVGVILAIRVFHGRQAGSNEAWSQMS